MTSIFVSLSHHEKVCVQLFEVAQAVHWWTGRVIIRQDDDIIIFRGRRALLPFYTAEEMVTGLYHLCRNVAM